MSYSPLDQFEIRDLITIDIPVINNIHISLTNICEYLLISFLIIIVLNNLILNMCYINFYN